MLSNRYNAIDRSEYLKRDALFFTNYVLYFLKNGFRTRNALFYPDYPDRRAAICKVMDLLGYNITNDPTAKADIVFHWEDRTFREPNAFLEKLSQTMTVINGRCHDISKKHVEAVFQEAFGYGTFVDPVEHEGVCVQKSDLNAQHDGRVIDCPIAQPEPDYIYQKLLNHVDAEGLVVDYRVAVFGPEIAFLKLRYKRLEDRFAHTIREVVVRIADYLSSREVANILGFCKKLGMDYGELDMIRNQEDGMLYIVDANSTPFRPPPSFNVSDMDRKWMQERSAEVFRRQFLG